MRLLRVSLPVIISALLTAFTLAAPGHAATTTPTKALVFIEENHSLSQMQQQMPYLNSLAQKYSYATNYTAVTHPSLPNYLAIAGGSTFGVSNDAAPATNAPKVGSSPSVFDQAIKNGRTAKTYAESMPGNCALATSGSYAVKHNPWTYFGAYRSNCQKYDVPLTPLAADAKAGTLPNVGMVIPNLCNDAHNCPLGTADNWLKNHLPAILNGPDFTTGKLAVIVTADEDDRSSGNKVLTVVMHAGSPHRVVTTGLTHYSLSGYLSRLGGASPLAKAASAPSFANAFGL